MAKKYDFEKVKRIIEKEKDVIEHASLGMHEDWFWTAEPVYEDGEFTRDLAKTETIGGIAGSGWATPVLRIEYIDGTERCIECFVGESTESNPFGSLLTSGPFSSNVQANMPIVEKYEP